MAFDYWTEGNKGNEEGKARNHAASLPSFPSVHPTVSIPISIHLTQEAQGAQKERKRRSNSHVIAQRRRGAEELSMGDAGGRKRDG
jgi:hypothetical protein